MEPKPSKRRRLIKRSLILLGVVTMLWLISSLAIAYRLTHRMKRPFAEPAPAVSWGKFESHRLSTRDGLEIGAWYLPGRDEAPSVLVLHGNKGSRASSLTRAELLAKMGCSVLLISLRAHGDSTGEFNDIGYGARLDVVAAVEFLERRRPGKPIVVQGTSLGSAAAIFASKELGRRVNGYILESPYRDLRVAVRNRTENELPPVLDWVAYRGMVLVSPLVLPHLDQISPYDAIVGVPDAVPVLILAGEDDLLARPHEAEALFDRVKTHGELHVFPKAAHIRMWQADPERYERLVKGMVDKIAKSPDAPG